MELRWENFGIERRNDAERLGLAVPATSSLQNLISLAECTGPRGFSRLCIDAANILNGASTLLFHDWQLILQRDNHARISGNGIPLDVSSLHHMCKTESVPDYIVEGHESVPMTLLSAAGSAD